MERKKNKRRKIKKVWGAKKTNGFRINFEMTIFFDLFSLVLFLFEKSSFSHEQKKKKIFSFNNSSFSLFTFSLFFSKKEEDKKKILFFSKKKQKY